MSIAPPDTDPTLPPFQPTTELVTEVAAALVGDTWDSYSKLEQLPVRQVALGLLTKVGDALLGAALDHVTTHHAAFGFDERLRDELIFARMAQGAAPAAESEPVPGAGETPVE